MTSRVIPSLASALRASAVLALTLAHMACGRSDAPDEERVALARRNQGDVVIGVAWPWSSYPDIRYGDGLQMAADEINAAGGVLNGRKLKLLREDDHGSVDNGRLVAQKLAANPEVVAVIGHLQSYVSVPAAAIYDLAGIVMVAPTATDPELTARGYHRVFRATFTDKEVGRQMADFARGRGYRRVAICYIRNAYGRGLANAFEERLTEAGGAVPARQSYDASGEADVRSFLSVIREWKHQELDAVFLAGESPSAGAFIEAAHQEGLRLPILGSDALNAPGTLALGLAAEGTVVPSVFHPAVAAERVQRFARAFQERYGVLPDAGAALGYDAVHLLAAAIARARSSVPDEIARALRSGAGWEGVTGAFTFTESGDLEDRPLVQMHVRNGQFTVIGASTVTAARD
ncbi:MAG: ABC transporter substrate-binding protein [Gemmatimonadaceae bacterium]|nr:ABC transporter substrate-binding protein [Gemmatimonadaceae bacterium]